MKIHLQNFNNLKNLTYEIKNRKVNFLFGISGSGKSSISRAINAKDLTNYVTAGQPLGSCSVSLEDKEYNNDDVPIYDYEYMNNVLLLRTNKSDIYSIIYAGEESLSIYRLKYDEYLGTFKNFKDQLLLIRDRISALTKALKIEFNQNKTYKSTCLIRKFEDTITSKGRNTLAHKYAGSRAQWFADGAKTEEYMEGKCPFCSKVLTDKRKEIISSIISIDSKSFEKIMQKSSAFIELNLELPVWNSKASINKFRKKLHDIVDAKTEIEDLLAIIDASYKPEFEICDIKTIKISKKVKELFPDLNDSVSKFNASLVDIKKLLGKIKSQTISLISKNITCINDYLKRFSIPYVFEKTNIDSNNHVAEYLLRHEDDMSSTDRVRSLSFGEKNIIGLILFVLTYKNRKMLIIDDPASSFDNYRRKIILDLIFEMKQPDSTILVLSHDEVFIKLALFYATGSMKKLINRASMSNIEKKYSSEIGTTSFIENGESQAIIDITIDDFDSIDAFIKVRLKTLPRIISYQTAILIRLLYECKTHKTNLEKAVYGYLSAIIHETPYTDIIVLLNSTAYSEKDILKNISQIVGAKYHRLNNDYLLTYKTLNYNDLEFVALFRELLKETKDKQKKAVKTELNSIIHLSSTYLTCLNPFKFRLYSVKTHLFLKSEKNKWLSS